jgi:hypothetical protein
MHAAIGHGFPPASFVERFSLLQNFQVLHGGRSRGETLLLHNHYTAGCKFGLALSLAGSVSV